MQRGTWTTTRLSVTLPWTSSELMVSPGVLRESGPGFDSHPTTWSSAILYTKTYQTDSVRYSRTAAVLECSEWTADNGGSPSARCLFTHTHSLKHTRFQICMHADTHSYQSQGVSALSKLFQPRTIQRVTDRSKGRVCECVWVCLCVCVSVWVWDRVQSNVLFW